jgi:transcription elongation factor Elf1
MSPRKSRYALPEWIAQSIRQERKNLLHGPYVCPKCKMNELRILVKKQEKEVVAVCSCGLEYPLKYVSAFESIDYYNRLIDRLNKK